MTDDTLIFNLRRGKADVGFVGCDRLVTVRMDRRTVRKVAKLIEHLGRVDAVIIADTEKAARALEGK